MQIVIDIPKEQYNMIKSDSYNTFPAEMKKWGLEAIRNGVPLPKHGRLIDADELKKEYPHDTDWDYPVNTNSYVVESIDNSHTIIEADKESEDA
jgi:hypothetical protein